MPPRPLLLISKSPFKPHLHPRYNHHLLRKMSTTTTPPLPDLTISATSSPTVIAAALPPLLAPQGGWQLTPSHAGVHRAFKFKTFKATWAFMNDVAEEAKRRRHHPEWSNVYNTTLIRWTTHHPPGLSELDVEMAAFCDKCAAEHGELPAEPTTTSTSSATATSTAAEATAQAGAADPLCELADGVVAAGAECCVPKHARKGKTERDAAVVDEELHEKGP